MIEGDGIMAASVVTFYCAMLGMPERPMPATLSDFALVKLEPRWVHAMASAVPLSNFTQQMVHDVLMGLEWTLQSDIDVEARTSAWMSQFQRLFAMAATRAAQICRDEHELDVLDMPEWRTCKTLVSVGVSYDSDDDEYAKKQRFKRTYIDPSTFQVRVESVTPGYMFIMDTLVSSIALALEMYTNGSPLAPGNADSLDTMRTWLFAEMKQNNEATVCKAQATWTEKLLVSPAQIRLFQFTHGIHISVQRRVVLLQHNETAVPQPVSSFLELETRPVIAARQRLRRTTDGVLACLVDPAVLALVWWESGVPDRPAVYRDRVRNVWVAQKDASTRFMCPSFAHALRELSKHGCVSVNPHILE